MTERDPRLEPFAPLIGPDSFESRGELARSPGDWQDDPHRAAIAARGLEPDDVEHYGNGVRKAVYRDPDGNEIGFGGAPANPADPDDKEGR